MRWLYFRNRDTDLLEAVDVERVVRYSQGRSHKVDEYHCILHLDDGTELHARGKLEDIVEQAEHLVAHEKVSQMLAHLEMEEGIIGELRNEAAPDPGPRRHPEKPYTPKPHLREAGPEHPYTPKESISKPSMVNEENEPSSETVHNPSRMDLKPGWM